MEELLKKQGWLCDLPNEKELVEEKFEKYFGYLARCEENFVLQPQKINNFHQISIQNFDFLWL